MTLVRVGLAQINPTVGDLDANLGLLLDAYRRAVEAGCELVAFPEMALTGYPPEDLLLKPGFITDNLAALDRFATQTGSVAAVVGFVDRAEHGDGVHLHNAAAFCVEGSVAMVYHKRQLPNYAVFDEVRYFEPGRGSMEVVRLGEVPVAVSICEDIWGEATPVVEQGRAGARLNININGSPYEVGKVARREAVVAAAAQRSGSAVVYVNLVGGQDELVFDGNSMVVDSAGRLIARSPSFVEDLLIVDVPVDMAVDVTVASTDAAIDLHGDDSGDSSRDDSGDSSRAGGPVAPLLELDQELYEALVLGTRDYCRKNGFSDVVIGLSGGIDSSLVACVAVDALGSANVHGVAMPSRYSSDHSLEDAQALARELGIELRTIPIEPAYQAYLDMLALDFDEESPTLTLENLQSRCRGQVLMALSNEFGWMVVTTGNKSELAVGYFTLYGDSVGGYGVIKDLLKTRVFELSRYVNRRAGRAVIPERVLTKPPSAELRPDQRDDQRLPPYEVLDPILELYVEQDRTAAEIIAAGFDAELVTRVARLVDLAEYKRRQMPPGVRATVKAFGKDRRMPLTSGYRGG